MRASGMVQPTMAPACEERKSDLRPVAGCTRTRRWRTGLKAAISSGVRSVKPICSREYIKECSQIRSSISALVRVSRAS